ncbi:MAG: glycosyltransferase family 2 protein [Candidatus Acidiferrales bacterium]
MRDNSHAPPRFSIVIPVHDEQESVRELYQRLDAVMSRRFEPVEFIFVDDHSSDATPELLAEIAELDPRVMVVRLKRNYGQTIALSAGFDHATGDVILSMDGDLQHDPSDIPTLLEALETGDCDIVSGWRQKRVDNFLFRRLPSRIANWMMAKLSGVDIHDFGTTFKAYRRETIKDVRLYGELHRFIPALAAWNGAKVVEVPIKNIVRPQGRSHYGIGRTFRVLFDLITIRFLLRYMSRPLHFFGPPGALGVLGGGAILFFLFLEKIIYHLDLIAEHGPLMLFAIVLFLFGVQLLAIGLIGELVTRAYFEGAEKPSYRVERIVGSARLSETPR